jgi:hypothetical protein
MGCGGDPTREFPTVTFIYNLDKTSKRINLPCHQEFPVESFDVSSELHHVELELNRVTA